MKSSYLILALGLAATSACSPSKEEINVKNELITLRDQLEEKVAYAQTQLEVGSIDPLNDEYKVIECYRAWRDYHFSTRETGEHNWKYRLLGGKEGSYNWEHCIDQAVKEISDSNLGPNLLDVGIKSAFEKHCGQQILFADEFIYCANHLKFEPSSIEIEED